MSQAQGLQYSNLQPCHALVTSLTKHPRQKKLQVPFNLGNSKQEINYFRPSKIYKTWINFFRETKEAKRATQS